MADTATKNSMKKVLVIILGVFMVILVILSLCCTALILLPQKDTSSKIVAKNCSYANDGQKGNLIDQVLIFSNETTMKTADLPFTIPEKYANLNYKDHISCYIRNDEDRMRYGSSTGENDNIFYTEFTAKAGSYVYSKLRKSENPGSTKSPEVTVPLENNKYLRVIFKKSASTGKWVALFLLVYTKDFENEAGQKFNIEITSELRKSMDPLREETLREWNSVCPTNCNTEKLKADEVYSKIQPVITKKDLIANFNNIEEHEAMLREFIDGVEVK